MASIPVFNLRFFAGSREITEQREQVSRRAFTYEEAEHFASQIAEAIGADFFRVITEDIAAEW